MGDEEEGGYQDVYVLFPQAAPDIVQHVQRTSGEEGPVRFVASVTGSYDALAVVEVEPERDKPSPLAALPRIIAEVFGEHVEGDPSTQVPLIYGPTFLRHTRQYPQIAFVGIRVRPGNAREVLGLTSVVPGYNGSAVVAGPYDVFLEIGASSFDQLKHRLLDAMHPVKGILWSESFIVTDHYYRGTRK
jgi:DNA-binding Lrp family transcriptional regulator